MAKSLGGVSAPKKPDWGPTPDPPKTDRSTGSISPGTFKEPGGKPSNAKGK
jgi:hypothetical protein